MFQRACVAVLCLLAACGGGAAGGGTSAGAGVGPAGSAEDVVLAFLEAAADSNLTAMASLWGTQRGSAAATGQPPDYERRIVVMQAYLAKNSYRIVSNVADGDGRRALLVEMRRPGCVRQVPFKVVRTAQGSWVVSQVDLAAVGTPGRPCAEQRDST